MRAEEEASPSLARILPSREARECLDADIFPVSDIYSAPGAS